ncbi:MAG: acyl-CoA dehydrogenase family protein [Alphaproteobacteria bacterium]|nr:acyl-CoA dehydrogenase family protein [Alphaproteobacteria bacterium]MBV9861830.1 acyl-CoA dehydrogenase family protein [Alphaproteobacteria bacterium]
MAYNFHFDPIELPPEAKALREQVRAFLRAEIEAGTFSPYGGKGSFSKAFARKVGAKGWIGMTWPKQYGGQERSHLERYVVTEEMLAHRAPTRSYSTADRQSGPVILRYGQEEVKQKILPRIASGELCFCIGLSEPNSGSDVFAASTRATRTEGGWLVNGRKIWTSNAHNSDYMIGLLRTSPPTKENRRHGLTQFLIDMKTPGITTRPIVNLTGQHDFNEVVFDDAFVPDLHLIGEVDMAWKQATDELAYERSGPDRWIETFPALVELVRTAGASPDDRLAEGIGRQVAHLATLRRMSLSVAGMLQAGKTPAVESAVVKDLGTNFEQALPDKVRLLAPQTGDATPDSNDDRFEEALRFTTLIAPKLTIQGGTREVLRGIIARGLGLR